MKNGVKYGTKYGVRKAILSAVFAALLPAGAQAQQAAKELFGRVPLPSAQEAKSFGFYTKGCISGAVAMPTDGPSWQAMRLERNRRWGHPQLISLIQRLSQDAQADGWPGLLVGDISQPRGGPMLTGHASHQVGLDADIWLTKMPNRRLSTKERAEISAVSVLKKDSLYVDPNIWSPEHGRLLRRAASYSEVERIFVHPGIKKAMCDTYGSDRSNDKWMIKLRPYYGHHYHFHIRINCPADSPNCRNQEPVPSSGNGCDNSLAWWFTDEPWAPPKPSNKPAPKPKPVTLSDLPSACTAVLRAAEPASEDLVTMKPGFDRVAAIASAVPAAPVGGSLPSNLPIPGSRPAQ